MRRPSRVTIYKAWRFGDAATTGRWASRWNGAPGYIAGLPGISLDYGDDQFDILSIKIVFHSERCAKAAINFLNYKGIRPIDYHRASDDEVEQIKRDIIAALPW